jgi:hypothetical protein
MRDFYKVLLLSQSGKGKTYSFREMNPETTGFLNLENKPLPFKNQFKYHFRPSGKTGQEAKDLADIEKTLTEFAMNGDINCIVIDSISAYMDILLRHARKTRKGFDTWNFYNEEIDRFINLIKRVPKEVFVTAHYEILGVEGVQEKRAKVKGKEWEGLIEKEFTVVLYGTSKAKENGRPEYFFNLYEEDSSSKCPPGIFGEEVIQIPNDSKMVLDHIIEFTK